MLAIIIPYFKLTFFEATLQSLENQTDHRFRVYIGDDASTENPVHVLQKFEGKFDYKYHRFDNNIGGKSLTQQWERCIALSANEEWLMILGDDDVLGSNVVEAFYKNIDQIILKASVVRFATYKMNKKGELTSSIYLHPESEKATDFLFRNTRSSLSEYVFNTYRANALGFKDFPLAWYADVLAVMEFSGFNNIFSINEAQVFVRITDLSISGKKDNLKLKAKAKFEFYYYILNYKKEFFDFHQQKEILKKLNNCYLNDKKKLFLFFKISSIYMKNLLIKDYFRFVEIIILDFYKKLKIKR